MNGLCPQCEKKYREKQSVDLLEYMKSNAADESLSPEMRQQCAEWVNSVGSRRD